MLVAEGRFSDATDISLRYVYAENKLHYVYVCMHPTHTPLESYIYIDYLYRLSLLNNTHVTE